MPNATFLGVSWAEVGVMAGKESSLLSSLPLKKKAVAPDEVNMATGHLAPEA